MINPANAAARKNVVHLQDVYVLGCPACNRTAFLYQTSGTPIAQGSPIYMTGIHGAKWKEATIPCCAQCDYAFGPSEFKVNRFTPIELYLENNPTWDVQAAIPDSIVQINVNEDKTFFQKLYFALQLNSLMNTVISKPHKIDTISGTYTVSTDLVWEYFRKALGSKIS